MIDRDFGIFIIQSTMYVAFPEFCDLLKYKNDYSDEYEMLIELFM